MIWKYYVHLLIFVIQSNRTYVLHNWKGGKRMNQTIYWAVGLFLLGLLLFKDKDVQKWLLKFNLIKLLFVLAGEK